MAAEYMMKDRHFVVCDDFLESIMKVFKTRDEYVSFMNSLHSACYTIGYNRAKKEDDQCAKFSKVRVDCAIMTIFIKDQLDIISRMLKVVEYNEVTDEHYFKILKEEFTLID